MLKKAFKQVYDYAVSGVSTSRKTLAIVLQTISRFENTGRRTEAAALTYTTLFALVPVLTVVYSIASMIPVMHEWGGDLSASMLTYVLPEGSDFISQYLLKFSEQARNLTWLGVVFLFVTSIMLLSNIERQFNDIWNVETPRAGMQVFMRYWAVLTLGPVFIVGAITASSVLISLPLVSDTDTIPLLIKLLPLLFNIAAFMAVYLLVPNCRVPWKSALISAVLIALCFEAGKYTFTKIMGLFPSYQLIYGAFAAVPLFLLWVYISWVLLLFGAELSYALSNYSPAHRTLPLVWRRIRLVQFLAENQQQGRLLSEAKIVRRLDDLSPGQIRLGLRDLKMKGFITLTQENNWVWILPPETFNLAQLLQDLTLEHLEQLLPDDVNITPELRKRWLEWQKEWLAEYGDTMGRSIKTIL